MLDLKDVTLFCVDTKQPDKAQKAIDICTHYANFGKVVFIKDGVNINSLQDYSNFILGIMPDYIETDFVLTVHWDGFILNPQAWSDEFMLYDYIGAPWFNNPISNNPNMLVGNGGFSLRSKRLINKVKEIVTYAGNMRFHPHEDIVICVQLREFLEKENLSFAPIHLAEQFAVETKGVWTNEFGFHNFDYINPYRDGWINPLEETNGL